MFDEEPGDPHGECAAEIAALREQIRVLRQALSLALSESRVVTPDEPHERRIPCQHAAGTIRQMCVALAATEPKERT